MIHRRLKRIVLMTSFFVSVCATQGDLSRHSSEAVTVVQRQLGAYNAHDLQTFAATYSDDVMVYRPPVASPTISGNKKLSDFYRDNRRNRPKLHAELLRRSVVGSKVIDHERITGLRDEPFEAVAACVVSNGLIQSVWLFYAE